MDCFLKYINNFYNKFNKINVKKNGIDSGMNWMELDEYLINRDLSFLILSFINYTCENYYFVSFFGGYE